MIYIYIYIEFINVIYLYIYYIYIYICMYCMCVSRSLEQGTRGFNPTVGNMGDTGTHGMTFKDQQTLTERTGAFKDRVTRALRRHTRGPFQKGG